MFRSTVARVLESSKSRVRYGNIVRLKGQSIRGNNTKIANIID